MFEKWNKTLAIIQIYNVKCFYVFLNSMQIYNVKYFYVFLNSMTHCYCESYISQDLFYFWKMKKNTCDYTNIQRKMLLRISKFYDALLLWVIHNPGNILRIPHIGFGCDKYSREKFLFSWFLEVYITWSVVASWYLITPKE